MKTETRYQKAPQLFNNIELLGILISKMSNLLSQVKSNFTMGVIHKPCSHQGGEGGLKISQNWLRYRYKSVYVRGEGGPKSPKKWLHGL